VNRASRDSVTATPSLLFVLTAALLASGGAAPATAQCTWPTLISGTVVSLGDGATPQFTMGVSYWTAIGVRGPAGDDWDLSVNSSTAAYPACVAGGLASSTYGGSTVDFVIGDFNGGGNPHGTYYARSYRYSGAGTSASVEWDDGTEQLVVNGYPVSRSTGPDDVLECWDVYLTGGTTYTLSHASIGTATTRTFLFRNPAVGAYWVGRSSAVMEVGMNTSGGYTAPSSGWYAVVVTNETGGTSTYNVGIGTCTPPSPLASGSPTNVPGPDSWSYFDQSSNYFTAVAVRSDDPNQDWDLTVFGAASGSPHPYCFGNQLASSGFAAGRVDVIIGDFNGGANAPGRYYVQGRAFGSTTSPAHVEWDDGPNQLGVDQPSVVRTTGPNDIIECWDVFLTAGQWYTFDFAAEGADLKYMVVRNPGSTFWVNRNSAEVAEFSSSEQYLAQTTDWYGVVVVNDNGAPGAYRLGISTCPQEAYTLPPNNTVYSEYTWKYALQVHPDSAEWFAFGTRSRNAAQDWDLTMYSDFTGGSAATGCAANAIQSSTYGIGWADYVVGYRRYDPPSFVFAFPYAYGSTTADGLMMWDQADHLVVDGSAISSLVDPTDIVRVFDVDLVAGATYQVQFTPGGAASLSYSVFGNSSGATFWSARGYGLISDATTTQQFTAPFTGRFAIVVTNESELAGSFLVRVLQGTVAVGDPPAARTRLVGLSPNPARGATRIAYELASPGSASFAVYDLAGRRVATLAAPSSAAGPGSFEWNGRDEEGRLVGTGVYFLSMVHEGRRVGGARLVLMP
jgi:hypothetical protein